MRAMLKHLSTVRVSTFYLMVAYAVVGFVCGFFFNVERTDVWKHVSDGAGTHDACTLREGAMKRYVTFAMSGYLL